MFLPLYLPNSSLMNQPKQGWTALGLWVLGQVSHQRLSYLRYWNTGFANIYKAFWLQQGAALEFFGISTFVPGLWLAGLFFFAVNCWILGVVVADVGQGSHSGSSGTATSTEKIQ